MNTVICNNFYSRTTPFVERFYAKYSMNINMRMCISISFLKHIKKKLYTYFLEKNKYESKFEIIILIYRINNLFVIFNNHILFYKMYIKNIFILNFNLFYFMIWRLKIRFLLWNIYFKFNYFHKKFLYIIPLDKCT